MKKIIFVLFFSFIVIFSCASVAQAIVHVNGYFRKNGTYVAPHYRSDPNSTPTDNWSYPGNTNPMTGKTATGSVEEYLENYKSSSSYTPTYTPTYTPLTTICPINSYLGIDGSCYCNVGYSASGSTCITNNQACQNKNGIFSYAIDNQCYCNPGYVFLNNQCVAETASCQSVYGSDSYGYNGHCYCNVGYQWNTGQTSCVINPSPASISTTITIDDLLKQIADLQRQINDLLNKK
ncbi:MAG: hypothetical protein ABSF55_01245 [Candidatus Staskawiczbacteria bacterium]|jgi:hypothetical protein